MGAELRIGSHDETRLSEAPELLRALSITWWFVSVFFLLKGSFWLIANLHTP